MTKLITALLLLIISFAAACATGTGTSTDGGKPIKQGSAGNNLTATLSTADGTLKKGKQTVTLKFTDASGKTVDVGAASLNFHMPEMGTMPAMNNAATLTTTATPGVYSGNVDIEMAGDWEAQITYQGPAGTGKVNLPLSAK